MQNFMRAPHVQPSLCNIPKWHSKFGEPTTHAGRTDSDEIFPLPRKIKIPNLQIVRYICQFEQYLSHRQNERRAHPRWAPTKEPTVSCWRYTPTPNQALFQDLLIHMNLDDPDVIIPSNFILALVVLNNSIIRPPSFHLPFICHPSFMAFVKLKRSWFNSFTIFTSQVSLAMDPSLCLQMTSSFPLLVQLMPFPFPIITEPFMGTRLCTTILLLVI